jgi:hypothetical protein
MKYYIYKHTRLDTNKVFYIGKGTKKSKGNIYYRAYTKSSRNQYWLSIVNKVPYKVDILLEFDNEKECLLKETELITFYGFSWNNTGTLCNIVKDDKEIKHLARQGSSKNNSKKVYQYSLEGDYIKSFNSIAQAKKEHPCDIYNACCQRKTKTAGGFQWRTIKYDKLKPYSKELFNLNNSKSVLQYDKKGNFIKEWQGTKQPSEALNINRGAIRNCLCGIAKSAGNYVWKYMS